MDQNDSRNVRRVLRHLSSEWRCPVWAVERTLQENIDRCWEKAMLKPEDKALWDKYFPDGKPTAQQYVLWLGRAHENREHVPYLLKD